jgi:predicted ester cyclase
MRSMPRILSTICHNPACRRGDEGLKQGLGRFFDAFPDCQNTLKLVLTDEDMVIKYGTLVGTHTGRFFGIPPTGKKVTINHLEIHRFKDGKIIEAWHLEDIFGTMRQVGALPVPESSRG